MRALVSGAAGFIGSHLVDQLLEAGHTVIGIDNLAVGRLSNLAAALELPRFEFVEGDVRDAAFIDQVTDGVDHVFHLAAMADIVPSMENPQQYFETNVDGTFNVLEAARKHAVKRLVYAASSSCYGEPDVYPTPESAEIRPMYPYALTKRLGEEMVLHWGQTYRLPVISLRFSNVFGPRARTSGTYGAVFGVFLAQKLAGKPFTVVGDGTQTRDFTYVTDVVAALIAAAQSNVRNEIMNVGSGDTYSVNRLVSLLGGPVIHIPKRPGEPDCTFADTKKIRAMLDWAPKVSFEEGVARLLEHIGDFKDAPVWDPESIEVATRD